MTKFLMIALTLLVSSAFVSSVDAASAKLCKHCHQVCSKPEKVCKQVCKGSIKVCTKKCTKVDKDCKKVCKKSEDICKKVTKPGCVAACIALLGPIAISKAMRDKCTNGCQKMHCIPGDHVCKTVCVSSELVCKTDCALTKPVCKSECSYTKKVCKEHCKMVPCPTTNK